jgi:hypothetical protein
MFYVLEQLGDPLPLGINPRNQTLATYIVINDMVAGGLELNKSLIQFLGKWSRFISHLDSFTKVSGS